MTDYNPLIKFGIRNGPVLEIRFTALCHSAGLQAASPYSLFRTKGKEVLTKKERAGIQAAGDAAYRKTLGKYFPGHPHLIKEGE